MKHNTRTMMKNINNKMALQQRKEKYAIIIETNSGTECTKYALIADFDQRSRFYKIWREHKHHGRAHNSIEMVHKNTICTAKTRTESVAQSEWKSKRDREKHIKPCIDMLTMNKINTKPKLQIQNNKRKT